MSDPFVAAGVVFAFGFATGAAVVAAFRRTARAPRPEPRTRGTPATTRPNRDRVIDERLAAIERLLATSEPRRTLRRTSGVGPGHKDSAEVSALLALGFNRREALARLGAVPEDLASTEERVTAALRAPGQAQ